MLSDSIFRKKSLDKISSPEQIDEYIKVVRPAVWVLFAAIILLLAAGIVWAFTARIDVQTVVNGQTVTQQIAPISYIFP